MAVDQGGGELDIDSSSPQGHPDGLTRASKEVPISDTQQEQAPTTTEAPRDAKTQPQPDREQTPSRPTPPPAQPRDRESQVPFASHVPEDTGRLGESTPVFASDVEARETLAQQPIANSADASKIQTARGRLKNQHS